MPLSLPFLYQDRQRARFAIRELAGALELIQAAPHCRTPRPWQPTEQAFLTRAEWRLSNARAYLTAIGMEQGWSLRGV